MIATLRYYDGHVINDGRIVFPVIAKSGAEIIKTSYFRDEHRPRVTISVDSLEQLNNIIQEANEKSTYEVSVIKVKKELLRKRGK